MYSDAKTVLEYLDALPDDRRDDISKVRRVILKSLPKGYEDAPANERRKRPRRKSPNKE